MGDANILKLVVEDDDGNRSVVPVEPGEITLGRDADNTVTLTDRNISRKHAKLTLDSQGIGHAHDLGSYNGVFINGSRIEQTAPIAPGDTLRLGDVQLELRGQSTSARPMADEPTERQQWLEHEGTQPGDVPKHAPFGDEATRPNGDLAEPAASGKGSATAMRATAPPSMLDERTVPGEVPAPFAPSATGGPDAAVVPKPPYARLLCLGPPRTGIAFELTRAETVFGRTTENHVALDHPSISRQHAIIRYDGRGFSIADGGSANGSFVNGTGVKNQALVYGDIVELGHVRLRLLAPNEEPVLSAAEQAQAMAELGQKPQRQRLWLLAASLVAGVLGLVGTAAYMRRPPARPSVQASHLAVEELALNGGEEEAQSLLQQARGALDAHQYARAGALANAVLAIDPKDPQGTLKAAAQAIVVRAGAEEHGEQALGAAKKAIAQQAWPDAFNALQNVPAQSSMATEAQLLLAQVRPALLQGRLAEAKESAEGHDWDEVELLVQEIGGLEPGPSEQAALAQLRQALAEGRKARPPAATPSKTSAQATKSGAGKKGERTDAAGRTGKGGRNDASFDSKRTANLSNSDDAKMLYAEGTRALGQGQMQRAIDSFNRCLVADKGYSLCYRALGIAYAKSGSGAKAARFYRLYLKVDPDARDAGQVRSLLQQYNSHTDGNDGSTPPG